MATLATLVALPVLVSGLTSAKQGGAPVAAVPGAADLVDSLRAAASSGSASASARDAIPAQRSNLPRATSPTQPTVLDIAIPQTLPGTTARGLAAYRRLGAARGAPACASPLVPLGARVKIVNVDNGHELTCVIVSNAPLGRNEVIAVQAASYAQLGDPVQAPLPVLITW